MTYDFDRIPERRNTNSIKWNLYPEDVLPAWVADMDFTAPPPVIEALRREVERGVFGYDFARKPLLETVAARMQRLYGWQVSPEAVVPVPGLVSAFNAAAWMVCQPGEGYVIQPPVYMPFNDLQKNFGIIRQDAPLVKTTQGVRLGYELDWDVFEHAFDSGGSKTRMFLLCNPHNPSGQVYSRDELMRMAGISLKHGALIVSDEIHSELLLDGASFTPIATLSAEIEQRSITLIAPSKTFNVPGLYCGFAIIPDPDLRERYKKVLERATLHVTGMGMAAAQAAFSGECDPWLTELRAYLTANRDFLVDFVERELSGLRVTRPQATYLAWMDCSGLQLGGTPFKLFLNKGRVALNEGAAFGVGGEGCVRLNFGAPRALLAEALERMKKALS